MENIFKSLLIAIYIIIGALAASYGLYIFAIISAYLMLEFSYEIITEAFNNQTVVLYN
jgi:hypothetical protein